MRMAASRGPKTEFNYGIVLSSSLNGFLFATLRQVATRGRPGGRQGTTMERGSGKVVGNELVCVTCTYL